MHRPTIAGKHGTADITSQLAHCNCWCKLAAAMSTSQNQGADMIDITPTRSRFGVLDFSVKKENAITFCIDVSEKKTNFVPLRWIIKPSLWAFSFPKILFPFLTVDEDKAAFPPEIGYGYPPIISTKGAHWWKRIRLRYVFIWKDASYGCLLCMGCREWCSHVQSTYSISLLSIFDTSHGSSCASI